MAFSKTPSPTTNNLRIICTVHSEIIETHILTRLDGPTLASLASVSSQFYSLASNEDLWAKLCVSTWPSSDTPLLRHLISTFPNGGRSFFSNSYPSIPDYYPKSKISSNHKPPSQLISAVDIYYRDKSIFSKVVETETVTGWFRCSPFRIDLLETKEKVSTPIKHPDSEETCEELLSDMALSWILIDPVRKRAVNVSSYPPVSVERHWLSGEVEVRFASILAGKKGSSTEFVECRIVVTSGVGVGKMKVREVSLQVEDMDGNHLNGNDSLVILERVIECERRKIGRRKDEGKKRYKEYLEMKKERREKKLKAEGALDMLCLALAFGLTFASFAFIFCSI